MRPGLHPRPEAFRTRRRCGSSTILSTGTDGCLLHYTLDGSEPTPQSPVYDPATPLEISRPRTIKVRYLEGALAGPTVEGRFDVQDTIPPRIVDAATIAGIGRVLVRFSEPVDPASASNAGNYQVADRGSPLIRGIVARRPERHPLLWRAGGGRPGRGRGTPPAGQRDCRSLSRRQSHHRPELCPLRSSARWWTSRRLIARRTRGRWRFRRWAGLGP